MQFGPYNQDLNSTTSPKPQQSHKKSHTPAIQFVGWKIGKNWRVCVSFGDSGRLLIPMLSRISIFAECHFY